MSGTVENTGPKRVSFVPEKIEKKNGPQRTCLQLHTWRIIFIDLIVALGNPCSDMAQAYFLLIKGLEKEAMFTLFIHWIPAIPAIIHLITMKRDEYGVGKTIALSGMYLLT